MFKKLAKLKFMPNKFEIINDGDNVICDLRSRNKT